MHNSEFWKTVRWFLLLAAMVVIIAIPCVVFLKSVRSTSNTARTSLDRVLASLTHANTRIVEGRAEIVESNEISELALMELRMSATRRFENEAFILKYLPAGTKHLIARGHYRVTAGYRLEPGVSLTLDGNGRPVARFPEPAILGVELIDYEALSEKDGWANYVSPDDRAAMLRDLRQQMRIEAEKSGILDTVEAALKTRLADLLDTSEITLERTAPTEPVVADEPTATPPVE